MVVILTNCSSKSVKPHQDKSINEQEVLEPYWVKHPERLSPFESVGWAKSSFAGMHMQREEAIQKARKILAQRIEVYIDTEDLLSKNNDNGNLSKEYKTSVKTLTDLALANTYQVDAYINDREELFVLLGVKLKNKNFSKHIPTLNTTPFSIKPLLERRCYSENVLKQIKTKANMYSSKPVWFYRPNQDGSVDGEVGIAEKQENISFERQKANAILYAKASMQKKDKTRMKSSNSLHKAAINGEIGVDYESMQMSQSSGVVDRFIVSDIWMDPEQCDLYVYITKE